jgi:hypothetical protein
MAAGNGDWCRLHACESAVTETALLEEYRITYSQWFADAPGDGFAAQELHDQAREAFCYRIGRCAFLLFEVICGAGLAAITLNGGVLLSTILGCALALLVAGAASAVVSRWVRHDAAQQPAKQMHRIMQGLLVLGGLWLIASVTALTILRSPDAAIGASLFGVTMALLTLLSPLCSGVCGVAADVLSWSGRICRDLVATRSLSRELELLKLSGERGHTLSVVGRVIKTGAAGVVATLLCGATCRAAELPVYVYVDVSPSARAGDVTQLLKNFARGLSVYEGPDGLTVSVIPFYENAYMATSLAEVTKPGNRTRDCPVTNTEIVTISKSYAAVQQRRCDQLRVVARQGAAKTRSAEISRLSAAIDRLSELKLPGRCTAVNAIIKRAARERPNGVSIVIGDMVNSCAGPAAGADFQQENQIFVIPVGSRQQSIEQSFDSIQGRFASALPWVQVIESFRLEVVMVLLARREPRIPARH